MMVHFGSSERFKYVVLLYLIMRDRRELQNLDDRRFLETLTSIYLHNLIFVVLCNTIENVIMKTLSYHFCSMLIVSNTVRGHSYSTCSKDNVIIFVFV